MQKFKWDKERREFVPHTSKLREYAHSFISNNGISALNPYTLLVSTAGGSIGSVTLALVETNGLARPPKLDKRCIAMKRIVREWCNIHCGTTNKCAYRRTLPDAMKLRDFYNLIHRVRLKKQPLTEEIITSITDPKMRQELVEAACLAAL